MSFPQSGVLVLAHVYIPLGFPLQVWDQSYLILRLLLAELLLSRTCWYFAEGNTK